MHRFRVRVHGPRIHIADTGAVYRTASQQRPFRISFHGILQGRTHIFPSSSSGDKIQIHSDNLFQLDETEIEFIKAKRLENNDSIILEQKNNSDIIKAQKSTYTKDAGGLHNIINQIKTGEIVNGNFYNGTLEKVTTQTKKVIKKNS